MPSTIPYDPSLVLGNLVSQEKLDNLVQISKTQASIDAAEERMNSLIAMKESFDMTIDELINMNIDPKDLTKENNEVKKSIREAAVNYAKAKVEGSKKILELKSKLHDIDDNIESPIDYNRTNIKKMPLSADSLKMNVQYFSNTENGQDSSTTIAAIKAFITSQTDSFGSSRSTNASIAAQAQLHDQYSRNSIAGTLVISITCTHKEAVVLAPFILDVDKAIRVWNKIHKNDMIKTNSYSDMEKIIVEANTPQDKSITLLSGATYGSCFIGMVHVLNTTRTNSTEEMYSIAENIQEQSSAILFEKGFEIDEGGYGFAGNFSENIQKLFSTNSVYSHCTLISIGSIPSIKSSNLTTSVQGFANFNGKDMSDRLATLTNSTDGDRNTVDKAAERVRTQQDMMIFETSKISGVLSTLCDVDKKTDRIIDITSMMNALQDYINKALAGNIGVPINYYIKPITKSLLAEMWIAKYFPHKYLTVSGDDSGQVNNKTSQNNNNSTPQNNNEDTPQNNNKDTPQNNNEDTSQNSNNDTQQDNNSDTSQDSNGDTQQVSNADTSQDNNNNAQ